MRSALRKHIRQTFSCILAVCLAVSMVPSLAWGDTAPTVDNAGAFVGSNGTATGSTDVYMSVTQKFKVTDAYIQPDTVMGAASSDSGELGTTFEGGTPITGDDGQYYEATWAWETTANVSPASGKWPARGFDFVEVTDDTAATPTATLDLGAFFKDMNIAEADRPGEYTFTLTLKGQNCTGKQEFKFQITPSRVMKDAVTDETAHITIHGSFDEAAGLEATDLASATASAQKGLYDRFVSLAGTHLIDTAWQTSIVNETFLSAPELSYSQTSVDFPVSSTAVDAVDTTHNLLLLVMVGNAIEQREYAVAPDGIQADEIRLVNTQNAHDELLLHKNGAQWTGTFANTDATKAVGAFALAYTPKDGPDPATFTVKVITEGDGSGTFTPVELQKEYAAGAKPTYVFQADEGSRISGIKVTGIDGTSAYAGEVSQLANSVTFNGPADRGLVGNAAITVTFSKVTPPTPTSVQTLQVDQNQPGSIEVSYTALRNGQQVSMVDSDTFKENRTGSIANIVEGTEVQLNISAPENYTIDKVWLSAVDATAAQAKVDANQINLNGTSILTIPAIQSTCAKVWIEYVEGSGVPTVKHTVYGVVDGDAVDGEFLNMTAETNGSGVKTGRYSVEVAENYPQTVQVTAAQGKVVESVKLYRGATPDALAGAVSTELYRWTSGQAQIATYEYKIAAVTDDMTVVVAFKDKTDEPDPSKPPVIDPTNTYILNARVDGAGGTISPAGTIVVREGASQVFTVVPEDGFSVDKVTANGNSVGLTRNTDGYMSFTARDIAANMDIVATFKEDPSAPPVDEPPVVRVTAEGPGQVSPSGDVQVAKGENLTIALFPNDGAQLTGLTRNGQNVLGQVKDGSYVIENVRDDTAVHATFTKDGTTTPDNPGGTEIEVRPNPGQIISKIEMLGHTIEFKDDDGDGKIDEVVVDGGKTDEAVFPIVPSDDPDEIQKAIDEFNKRIDEELGYTPENPSDTEWVAPSGDGDGSYVITVPTEDADGNKVDPGLNVEMKDKEGGDTPQPPLYQYQVDINKVVEDGTMGGTLTVARNSQALGTQTSVMMNNEGIITVSATPVDGYDVRFSVSDTNALRETTRNTSTLVDVNRTATTVVKSYEVHEAGAITATFYKRTVDPSAPDKLHTIIASAGKGGVISPAGIMRVPDGANQVFTVVPDNGYTVDEVTANGAPVALMQHPDGYWYFTAYGVNSSLNIHATFKQDPGASVDRQPVRVKTRAKGPGVVSPLGTTLVANGETLSIALIPRENAKLQTLTRDGRDVTSAVSRNGVYLLENATSDTLLVATFVPTDGSTPADDDLMLDVDVTVKTSINVFGDFVGGSVSPNFAKVKRGGSQRFIIKPKDGTYIESATYTMDGTTRPCDLHYIEFLSQGNVAVGRSNEVEMRYAYVDIADITGDVLLNIVFSACEDDPANPNGSRYVYNMAEGTIIDVTPGTSGGVEVDIPGNSGEVVVGGDGDGTEVVVRPEPGSIIEKIDIYDHTIEFKDEDGDGKVDEVVIDAGKPGEKHFPIVPPDDPEEIQKAIDEFNKIIDEELGYTPDNPSGTDYVKPNGDGSYTLTLPTTDAGGNKVDPKPSVDASGDAGVLYQHKIYFKVATEGGSRGGYLTVERNGIDLGNAPSDVMMNHGGSLLITAHPTDAGDMVRFSVDNSKNVAPDTSRNIEVMARLARDASGVPQSYVVTGPGTITATFYKNTDIPDNPDVLGPADVAAGRAYAVTVEQSKNGTISPAGTRYYPVGANAEFNLIGNSGYHVASVTIDGVKQSWTTNKYTFVYGSGATAEQRNNDLRLVEQAFADPVLGGTTHTITAEFVPDSSMNTSGGKRALRTLQTLAKTGDLTGPGLLALMAVAFGAAGCAFLVNERRRRYLDMEEKTATHAKIE